MKQSAISLTIMVNGIQIDDAYAVLSANVVHELNRISYAGLVLSVDGGDGTAPSDPITDSPDLNPGNEIEIIAGFGSSDEVSIFKGIIVQHGVDFSAQSAFSVKLVCKHKAISTTFSRTDSEFAAQTDSAIMATILGNYPGLSARIESTTTIQENIFQKSATDWDFILARAKFYGFIIALDGDDIYIGKPQLTAAPALRIAMGSSIIAFSAALDAEQQSTSVDASAWDIKTQSLIRETASEPQLNCQGDITASSLSSQLGQNKMNLVSATPMAPEELQVWANSSLLRMRMGAIKGSVTIIGNARVKTGCIIELEGVGAKFNGKAFVAAVNHIIENGEWQTEVKFGLDTKCTDEQPDCLYMAAGGQLPPIHGLHIATVQKIFDDPRSLYRVLVNIPSNSSIQTGFWARLSNFYGTSGAGSFFFPEVGDEVIIGFLDSDPRYPIILGSVYSSGMKPPVEPVDNNNYIKSLVTKAQLKLSFDDEKKCITIVTPGGNSITIDDDGKSIEIKDQNNNQLKLNESGISLSSDKDVTINAQNISLTAKAKISLSATSDADINGMNLNLAAKVGLRAKGTTAELSATGQTTIEGAMVMIN